MLSKTFYYKTGTDKQDQPQLHYAKISYLIYFILELSSNQANIRAPKKIKRLLVKTAHIGSVLKIKAEPWLVWLTGLSAGLQTERSMVRFPVRAHAWVVGQVPSWRHVRASQLMFLWHIAVSLPLILSPFPSL